MAKCQESIYPVTHIRQASTIWGSGEMPVTLLFSFLANTVDPSLYLFYNCLALDKPLCSWLVEGALFHPVFSGFILAAVLAAVMSTADSQLLVLTSSLTEDLPFFSKFDDKKKAWISRFGVVGFALIAYIITASSRGTILAMVGYAWGGFGAAFGPLVILSLCWRGTTKYGALAGMIVGAVTIFVVKNYIKIQGEYFYELLPGFILAFAAIVIVSLATAKPSEEMLQKFDESQP